MRTCVIEFHKWEGFSRVQDKNYTARTLGFLTFTTIKHRISEVYRALSKARKNNNRDLITGKFIKA